MKRIIHPLFSLGLALALPSLARAEFNPAIVSADAQWLVYLDFNSLRESDLGRQLIEAIPQDAIPFGDGAVRLDVGKLLGTIGSATAYGTNLGDPKALDGALVLQGTPELRTIAEGIVAQETVAHPEAVTELKDFPFEAYSVSGNLVFAFPPEPIVLVGKSKEQLIKARELFRGEGTPLSKATTALTPLLPQSTDRYLVAITLVPSPGAFAGAQGPHARMLQMARAASLVIGEEGANVIARVRLVATSEDTADKLQKILQGVIAMLSLAETSDQQLTEFVRAAKVARSGAIVMLDLGYPTDRLVEMVKNLDGSHPPPAPAAPPAEDGKVVATWVADQQLGHDAVSAKTLVSRTVEDVELPAGAIITLRGRREAGENARLDYVDITPSGGGQALHFEAEYMSLSNYRVEDAPDASGGRLVIATGSTGTARLQFPGTAGRYDLEIGYVDEADGRATFSIGVRSPAGDAEESAGE